MDRQETNEPGLPVIDESAIAELERQLPGGSLDSALELFADDLEKRRGTLRRLVGSSDTAGLASLVHGMKGSAATFGAPGLARDAIAAEKEIAGRDAARIAAAASRMAAELDRVVERLRALLEQRSGAGS